MISEATGSANRIPVLLMARELGPGGTERQLVELARNLDRTRFEPHVGCFRPGIRTPELEAAGIPVAVLEVRAFASASAVRGALQLGRYLRRHRIRIVHTFDVPMNCFSVPVARAFRTPVVLSSQRGHRDLFSVRRLLRFSDRMSDGIVVNCEYIRRHLLEDEHVPADKIRLCYNGLDTEHFQPAARQNDQLTIGVTCVLRPEKGLRTLLEGFAQVHARRPGLRLILVGSGEMLDELKQLAANLGVASRCHFEPTTRDVLPWLNRMDIFVLPSLSEAFSNSMMEAMACECAVVASRTGGNPELVLEQKSGLLFETGNADDLARQLQRLIDDPGLRLGLARCGSQRIRENFSIASSTRRMESIYQEFVNGGLSSKSST